MILTGKCKDDFLKYASYNYGEDSGDLAMMRSVMRNALIIEFFDSQTSREDDFYFQEIYLECFKNGYLHESIRNIQKTAIKKAN